MSRPRGPRRLVPAALVFAISFGTLALLLQDVTYGDGIFYLDLARRGELYAHHHLYLPGMVAFMRLLEAAGIADRTACFLYSAFVAALGNAFLWLVVSRRVAGRWPALSLVFLASTAPVLLFFATTVENHGPHYGFVCLALWRVDVAVERRTWPSRLLAGVALAAVPASHLSGFMLLPALVLFYWSDAGRSPLFADWSARRLGSAAVLLVPLTVYALLFHLTTWFRTTVLGLTPDLLADPIGFEFESKILAHAVRPLHWIAYLGEAWVLPAFGTWAVFIAALPRLHARSSRLGWIAVAGVVPYIVLLPMHDVPERGAYFLALVPWASVALSWVARDGVLPRSVVLGCLGLGILQGGRGVLLVRGFPSTAPAGSHRWAQAWADDALRVDAGVPAGRRFYFCKDLWRTKHLAYDHGAGAVCLPLLVQQQRGALPTLLGVVDAKLGRMVATGPVYLTGDLLDDLPRLWPELRAFLDRGYVLDPVHAGRFRGARIRQRP